MLKVLLKLQFRSMISGLTKRRSRGIARNLSYGGYLLLLAAVYVFMGYSMYNMFESAAKVMAPLYLGNMFFGYASIMAFGLAIIGSAFSTQSQLFEAKDNDTLLSMPIRPSTILAARMLSLYLLTLAYESIMLVPAGIAWFVHTRPLTLVRILYWLIPTLLVPMIALAIGCLIGWILAMLSSHVQNKSYLQLGVSLVMLAAYFVIFFKVTTEMDAVSTSVQLLSGSTLKAIWPAYQYGMACNGSSKSVGLIGLASVLPLALVWLVISRFFFHIVNEHHHARKKEYVEGTMQVLSPRRALIRRERRRLFSDGGYLINSGLGILMALVMTAAFLIFLQDIRELYQNLLGLTGEADLDFLPDSLLDLGMLLVTVVFCFIATTITITAPSLSLEGKTIWQAGVLPVKPFDFLMAKVGLHLMLACPVFLLCSVVFQFFLDGSLLARSLLLFTPQLMILMTALLGMIMNILLPRFDWTSTTQCIKRSIPVFVCMMGGMLVILGSGVIYFKWLIDVLSPTHFLGLCTILLAFLCLAMLIWLKKAGGKKIQAYFAL